MIMPDWCCIIIASHATVLVPVDRQADCCSTNRSALDSCWLLRMLFDDSCQIRVLVCMRHACVLHEHNKTVSHCEDSQSATYKHIANYWVLHDNQSCSISHAGSDLTQQSA